MFKWKVVIRPIWIKKEKNDFPTFLPETSMVPSSFSSLAATSCVKKFWLFLVGVFVKDTRFAR